MVLPFLANLAWWSLRMGGTIGKALGNILHERTKAFPTQTPEDRIRAQERLGGLSGAVAGTVGWIRGTAYTTPKDFIIETAAIVTSARLFAQGAGIAARVTLPPAVRVIGVDIDLSALNRFIDFLEAQPEKVAEAVEAGVRAGEQFLAPMTRIWTAAFGLAGNISTAISPGTTTIGRDITLPPPLLPPITPTLPGLPFRIEFPVPTFKFNVESIITGTQALLTSIIDFWKVVEPIIDRPPKPVGGRVIKWWEILRQDLEEHLPDRPLVDQPTEVIQTRFFSGFQRAQRGLSDIALIIQALKRGTPP